MNGADATLSFIKDKGLSDHRAPLIWDLVALNSTPSLALHKEPEVAVGTMGIGLVTRIPTIDDVLGGHVSALGNDLVAYRNHVYRLVNLCVAIVGGRGDLEKIAAAAVFHDLGIWTDRTFDYIAPSIALAREYLVARAREDWIADISAMIADHHKITPSMANPTTLVEPFRQADWIDVTGGLRRFGIPRPFVARLFATWPDAGFHWRLVQLALHRFRTHPLTPLPMVRL